MEFIRKSLHMAANHKKRLFSGMIFVFLQHISLLIGFVALYLGFKWLGDLNKNRILILFGIIVMSFLINFLFGWMQNALLAGVFFTIYRDYRLKVGEKLKKAPMGYFAEQSLSRILAAFTNIIRSLESYSYMAMNFSISGLSASFFLLIGLFSLNLKIGILSLICIIVIWLCVFKLISVAKYEITQEHAAVNSVTDALVDGILGIPVLRSFPSVDTKMVQKIHSRLDDASENLIKTQIHFEKTFIVYSRIFTTILNISSLLVTLYCCYLYTKGEIMLAQALTLSAAGFLLFSGMKQLESSAILLVKNPAHMEYLEEVLDIPEFNEGQCAEIKENHNLEFKDVSFGYEAHRPVLKDLSFKINEGSKTAIVGPSGSGKTTIINLISRFYDPQNGSIELGGKDLRTYQVESLLKNISLVFQEVYLFNDTIENNIRFANPNANLEEIIEVSKKARCHDFIEALPETYQTMVGEGGSNLSGGEKQRISIARALLKNAPIVLLDEATSSVDPENEYEILRAIDELCKGKTVISIAHRLSTVKSADQILVIENGSLVQSGTHDELILLDGIYKNFIEARERAANWSLTGEYILSQ